MTPDIVVDIGNSRMKWGLCAPDVVEMDEEDECKHENIVDDDRTGDAVCTDCALVVEERMSRMVPIDVASLNSSDGGDEGMTKRGRWETYFADLCHNNMLNEGTAKIAMSEFCQMKREEEKSSHYRESTLAAYSMYRATLRNGSGRPPEEIASYTGVSTNTFCKLENVFPPQPELSGPSTFLPRFCYFLDLGWLAERRIGEWCSKITLADGFKPKTVTATLLHLF